MSLIPVFISKFDDFSMDSDRFSLMLCLDSSLSSYFLAAVLWSVLVIIIFCLRYPHGLDYSEI